MVLAIILSVLSIVCLIELIIRIISMFGEGASGFTYGICRPFGMSLNMFSGFMVTLLEVVVSVVGVMYAISYFL